MVTATVARGRSVQVADRIFGPGEQIDISPEDLSQLAAGGFILADGREPPPVVLTEVKREYNPAQVGLVQTATNAR